MGFNEDVGARFMFFNPGYMAGYRPTYIHPYLVEKYFSAEEIGKEAEIEAGSYDDSSFVKWKGPLGIIELKKGESYPSTPAYYRSKKLPILFKAINEERRFRGHKGDVE
jgi:hypothetical protein